MIKEAIEKILAIGNGAVLDAYGRSYSRHDLTALPSPDPLPDTIRMHTLSGLASYIESDFDVEPRLGAFPAVFIRNPEHVEFASSVFGDFAQRSVFAEAKPFHSPGFRFSSYMDTEEFTIAMQSFFVKDETVEAILKIVGNIQSEAVSTVADDGFSQTVTARAGVARVENVTLPNPVTLRPFRTFQEVEQPSSQFVLRVRSGQDGKMPAAGLFEVGDSQWMLRAVGLIEDYFKQQLGDEVPVFS